MDVLSDILDTLRLRGTLYFAIELHCPWGVRVPSYRRVARFHLVSRGSLWVHVKGQAEPVHLETGDLILVPHGAEHELLGALDAPVQTVDEVVAAAGFTGQGALATKATVTYGTGDVTGTHVAWSSPRGSQFVPSAIVVGDLLYLINDMQSILTVVEAVTGKLVYQNRLGVAMREGFSASPIHVNGKVFFTNDDGQTFVVEAGRTFKLLHVNELGAQTLASPALVDGTWYWRTADALFAIR